MMIRVVFAVLSFVALGIMHVGPAAAQSLVAAVLPTSRSVQVGGTATAFVTIINTGNVTATQVGISFATTIPATLHFQTTDPSTNVLTGTLDQKVDIPAGQSRSFLIAITPSAEIPPTDITFNFAGTNTTPVAAIVGVNTLLLSASAAATPDVIALAGTTGNDGIVNIPSLTGTGAFSVATANVGAAGDLTVTADTGGTSLPVTVSLCQTNPANAQCTSPVGPSVPVHINAGATNTFSVFVTGSAFVPFDPSKNRIFIRIKDSVTGATRGSTSVAVRTNLIGTYQGSGTVTLSNCTLPSNNGTSSGTFTANVTSQVGNTIGGTFALTSGGSTTQVNFSVTLNATGNIGPTTVSFSVAIGGFPVGSGTATLSGQITGTTVNVTFSGQLSGLETCTVNGSGSATRT